MYTLGFCLLKFHSNQNVLLLHMLPITQDLICFNHLINICLFIFRMVFCLSDNHGN